MRRKNIWVVFFMLLAGGVFCLTSATAVPASEKVLQSAGCKTEYYLLKDLASAYNAQTGTKIMLGNTGNKKAIGLLMDRKVDFAFTCKPISKLTRGLGLDPESVAGWQSIAIAKDPIVVVAHPEIGINNITAGQLAALFKGQFKNWQELGGNNLPVKTAYINPQLESGIVLLFKEFTVGSKGNLDENAMIANGPAMAGNYVSVTPGGVTFMGFNSYQKKYGNILEINGVVPTRENILDDTYGLTATYYITMREENNESVDDFARFATSGEGRAAIDQNFIFYSKENAD